MTTPTAVLRAPAGVTQLIGIDGTSYTVSAAGEVTVPVSMIPYLLASGFLLSAVEPLSITDAEIAVAAAIAYTKLALTGSVVDADIAAAAAIAISKVANPVPKLLNDRVLGPVGLAKGSTDTNLANIGFNFQVGAAAAGVNTSKAKAAVPVGTAFGALGTIPASKWGLILAQINASGVISFVSAAANYTTGYATEAAAKAAVPSPTAANAVMGYAAILASASGWVTGTDALAGGASGNPATTTNYYDAGLNY